jgi:hypothetical protein
VSTAFRVRTLFNATVTLVALLLVVGATAAHDLDASSGNGGEAVTDVAGPPCRLKAQAVFWTSTDWELLGQELKTQLSPCADYYISIPPLASDKTGLRTAQDDVIRRLGRQFHPVAEITLAGETGWATWVTAAPGRTWFDAGVEFRRRMNAAGYRPDLGETWLLNEFERSTRKNEAPYSRTAMAELLRGLYTGDGSGPTVPGIIEIGIAYTHQNIPDVEGYKSELKAWLLDSAFWTRIAPYVSVLTKEVYPDARFWGVPGTSRNNRARQLTQYMEHAMNLVNAGPAEIGPARALFNRTYMPLGSATWPARGPDPYMPPFCCGHGWTLMPLDAMLSFVSEQVYSIRRYAANHPPGAPRGRLGFSWQPTNNFRLPPDEWDRAKRSIASRIAAAIRYSYRPGIGSSNLACMPPGSATDWCRGADIPGAVFTDAWTTFRRWN